VIFYLTYSEAPSGIFSSQVIDVVNFLDQNLKEKIKLVAFISQRNYFLNKKMIKQQLPGAMVLPMFPKMNNWRANAVLLTGLCLLHHPKTIIARSVIATKLALLMRDKKMCNKVVYDGRGAIASEWKEYNVVTDQYLLERIVDYEKNTVLNSDFRISVSEALVNLWRKNFGYSSDGHVVIPCTLNATFLNPGISKGEILKKRNELGLGEQDTVFIYSGSIAGWQSFDLLRSFLEVPLQQDQKNKIVFFSPSHSGITILSERFPGQVLLKYLSPEEVHKYLIAGDYGLLIRDNSETNSVASPVKYAEYLSCGLKVIISANLGDYSALTRAKNWGFMAGDFTLPLHKPELVEKIKLSSESIEMFSKITYLEAYKKVI
jgi:hypothetical protein